MCMTDRRYQWCTLTVWSEDPYLTSRMVIEFVSGIQSTQEGYLQAIACCKHFAACSCARVPRCPFVPSHTVATSCVATGITDDVENIPVSRFVFDAQLNTRTMWETYMPAFEACIVEGQAQSVMCSYNSINGVPTCGDEQLLNGILREQWGFEGFVVSVRACGVQRWRDHESTALTVV